MIGAAVLLSCVLGVGGCVRAVHRPGEPVSIYLTGDIDAAAAARAAAMVSSRRAVCPSLWMHAGEVRTDPVMAAVGGMGMQASVLDAAGVDAVLLGPGWLESGVEDCRSTADRARFYLLGANILDEAGEPVGHPFMVRRFGLESVACVGVWQDSADVRLRAKGVDFVAPDYAVDKTMPLLRLRAETVGALSLRPLALQERSLDFTLGAASDSGPGARLPAADSAVRLDLLLQGGRVVEYSVHQQALADCPPDSAVARQLDSLRAAVDSAAARTVAEATATISPRAFTRAVVAGYLEERGDAFAYDGEIVRDTLPSGALTVRGLIEALVSPGRIVLTDMTGAVVKALAKDRAVTLAWRRGLAQRPVLANSGYRVAMTLDFLSRHPELAGDGFEIDAEPLWQVASRVLGAGGGRP